MSKKVIAIPALERGLDLLEWIISQSEPLTLTQIAQGMRLTVSEVQRPVACLQARGYLRRSPAGSYVISGFLYRLALSHPPHLHLQRAALPVMLDYARKSSQSVHLCVPDGDTALLLADVPGSGLVRISLQHGARLDSSDTVSGRILSAFGALTPQREDAALEAIRKRGYEQAASSYAEGIIDLGVPIHDASGQVIAVLTTSILQLKKSTAKSDRLLRMLQASANKVSGFL
ncbi:MAG TPA: helix-turn-helix domain-containing protein [Terrimicrobiaceae bacterium]|nr:helix-turn-helix domain-containing protein [Terrimicrobiaceae bacterium]